MTDRHETISLKCPECPTAIEISKNWTAGGINDYGGWVLQCNSCSARFPYHLGRDVRDSWVLKGATVIDQYDDELGDKQAVLSKHGLNEDRDRG